MASPKVAFDTVRLKTLNVSSAFLMTWPLDRFGAYILPFKKPQNNTLGLVWAEKQNLVGISAPKKIFAPPLLPTDIRLEPFPLPLLLLGTPPLLLFIKNRPPPPSHLLGRLLPLPPPRNRTKRRFEGNQEKGKFRTRLSGF